MLTARRCGPAGQNEGIVAVNFVTDADLHDLEDYRNHGAGRKLGPRLDGGPPVLRAGPSAYVFGMVSKAHP